MADGLNKVMKRPATSAHRLDVLTGRRFGRLVAGARGPNDRHDKPQWWCQCDCGKRTLVRSGPLRAGKSRSCGCIAAELTRERSARHGMTRTREWETSRRGERRIRGRDHPPPKT